MGNLRPRLTPYLLHLERRLEPRNPRHHPGSDARPLQTLSLKLAQAQSRLCKHLPNFYGRTGHGQAIECLADPIRSFDFIHTLHKKDCAASVTPSHVNSSAPVEGAPTTVTPVADAVL